MLQYFIEFHLTSSQIKGIMTIITICQYNTKPVGPNLDMTCPTDKSPHSNPECENWPSLQTSMQGHLLLAAQHTLILNVSQLHFNYEYIQPCGECNGDPLTCTLNI